MDQTGHLIPRHNSPWAILTAYLADRGEKQKINQIQRYLYLKDQRDRGVLQGDEASLSELSTLLEVMRKEYFIETDFRTYIDGDKKDSPEARDFARHVGALVGYINNHIGSKKRHREMIIAARADIHVRRNETSRFKDEIDRHIEEVRSGNHPSQPLWPELTQEEIQYLQTLFGNIARDSMNAHENRLAMADSIGQAAARSKDPDREWLNEHRSALQRSVSFLETGNGREDLSLMDLPFLIGEHRGATSFRQSTTGYYESIDALISGLVLSMPSSEQYRPDVDVVHQLAAPEFRERAYAIKLSYINAKHRLGLSPRDVELYATAMAQLGAIMRGYGIDEIDDRFKQYLHNSGDHSLRTMVTVTSLRDANISRLRYMREKGIITEDELNAQVILAEAGTSFLIRKAALHDMGEYLHEVLGNNLKDKNQEEERILRGLRDRLEEYITEHHAIPRVLCRLKDGPFAENWESESLRSNAAAQMRSILDMQQPATPPQFAPYLHNAFMDGCFDIIERLNSQQDIITLRMVGTINKEGTWQNAHNIGTSDIRYTAQYVWSKFSGHKFETIDPFELSRHDDEQRQLLVERFARKQQSQTAASTHSALEHDPAVTRLRPVPITSLPLDDYMLQRDINYEGSIFKKFVKQAIRDHLSDDNPEHIRMRQMQYEMLLHAIAYEAIHYTKKHARVTPGMDPQKVETAVRKTMVQGVAAARKELAAHGIELQYLQVPELELGRQRYRVGCVMANTVLGGILGDPQKQHQAIDLIPTSLVGLIRDAGTSVAELANSLRKPLNTAPQAMLLLHNDHISLKDFQRLLHTASTIEASGDINLALTGWLQKEATTAAADSGHWLNMDPKSIAIFNPLVTYLLESPARYAEAMEKCYGHILVEFGDRIAKKYGISEDALKLLKLRDHLGKGEFHKKPTDVTLSGPLAEKLYAYFKAQYSDEEVERSKNAETAERYMLRELCLKALNKAESRRATEISPAQAGVLADKVACLRETIKTIGVDHWFKNRASHNMAIRFGTITGLGAMMMQSGSGMDIDLRGFGTINTSLLFGGNLMLAGMASFLSALSDNLPKLPQSHSVRRVLEDLPHFELGGGNGIYISKRARSRTLGSADGDLQRIAAASLHLNEGAPGVFGQLRDCVIATMTTPFHLIATRHASSELFGNQNLVTTADTGAIMAGNAMAAFTGTKNPFSALAQGSSALATMLLFGRLNVVNMWMNKIVETIQQGKDPDYETIRMQVAEDLKQGASRPLLNLMQHLGRNTALGGVLASAADRTLYGADRTLSGLQRVVDAMTDEFRKDPMERSASPNGTGGKGR